MKAKWIDITGKYTAGKHYKLGKYTVGSVHWDSIIRGEPPYQATNFLPGIKGDVGKFETEELAMKRIEAIVAYWFEQIEKDFE